MKSRWKIAGIAAVAGAGIYFYLVNDSENEPQKSDLEEIVENYPAVAPPQPRYTPAPTASPEEEPSRIKPNPQQIQKKVKKETPSVQKDPSPKQLQRELDYATPDDKGPEEYPSYYIPLEERDSKNYNELMISFKKAIKARDYKIAETYFPDILKGFEPQEREIRRSNLMCVIVADYDQYLSSIIENCRGQDAYSVLSKVIWMKSFLNEYNTRDGYCFFSEETKKVEPDNLADKGKEALDSVINCTKNQHHE